MFILLLSLIGLEFWSVNHTSIYENSGTKAFKYTKFLGETSNNRPNEGKFC